MKRRNFIRIAVLCVVFAYGTCLLTAENEAPPVPEKSGKTMVVVARGNDLQETFDRAMLEFGGLKPFIEKGRGIAVKPDMSTDALPEEGLTTDPQLVKHISRECYKYGSGALSAFDYCLDDWTKCYKNSGIERLAKNSGVKMVPGNNEMYFAERKIEGATVLAKARIHSSVKPNFMLIDIPVLKMDTETTISGGLKNLMGCVLDRNFYNQKGLSQCLAEFLFYKKPELTVIDAGYLLGTAPGKTHEHVFIISTDVLAADAIACRMLGIDPQGVDHLRIAAELGFGFITETEIDVKTINLSDSSERIEISATN